MYLGPLLGVGLHCRVIFTSVNKIETIFEEARENVKFERDSSFSVLRATFHSLERFRVMLTANGNRQIQVLENSKAIVMAKNNVKQLIVGWK